MLKNPAGTTGDRWPGAVLGLGLPATQSLFLPSRTGQGWFLVWAPGYWLQSAMIPADSLAMAGQNPMSLIIFGGGVGG